MSPQTSRASIGWRNRSARLYRSLVEHGRRLELTALLVFGIGVLSVWGFIEIADAVLEGDARELDVGIILALRSPGDVADPIGPAWLEQIVRDFTALGGTAILTTITLAVAGYLILMHKKRMAALLLLAICGGLLLSTLGKTVFDRPRPDLVPHHAQVYTASFPSGHSMMAAVTYLTLGALLARIHKRRAVKLYFLGLAALLCIAVGASRVYLGVHWPTDVVAGWAAGAAWAMLCWLIAWRLQKRRVVEPGIQG